MPENFMDVAKNEIHSHLGATIITEANRSLSSIVTSIGELSIKYLRDKVVRTITFSTEGWRNNWLEPALYALLYKYNDIQNRTNIQISTDRQALGTVQSIYNKLGDGFHKLKYRQYNIMLFVKSNSSVGHGKYCTYTVSTFDTGTGFVKQFEQDLLKYRNDLYRFKANDGLINVFRDSHESDGETYWRRVAPILERPIRTIYLPNTIMRQVVDTVNRFFSEKEYYKKHGINRNLTLLLHGDPATGKDSLARTIATEWHRNLYYVTGGKGGRFVPDALIDSSSEVVNPLFLISDIDRYPFLINDELPLTGEAKEEKIEENKLSFAHMINALDGIVAGDNRIIIMTTNHLDKFSPTFIRPGRVDLILKLPRVTVETFQQFIRRIYSKQLANDFKLVRDDISVPELQMDAMFRKLPIKAFIDKYTIPL